MANAGIDPIPIVISDVSYGEREQKIAATVLKMLPHQ